jgi:hypothetical protein
MQKVRNESSCDQQKKVYVRPQLIAHGAVEALTQHVIIDGGPSNCMPAIDWLRNRRQSGNLDFTREEYMKYAVTISATDRRSTSQPEKKPYSRPQLANHGKVESLTQTAVYGNPSQVLSG